MLVTNNEERKPSPVPSGPANVDFFAALGDAREAGELPEGVRVTVAAHPDELFSTIAVDVVECPFAVHDGAGALTTEARQLRDTLHAIGGGRVTVRFVASADRQRGLATLAAAIGSRLDVAAPTTARNLLRLGESAFGASAAAGAFTIKDAYEAGEWAINAAIRRKGANWTPNCDLPEAQRIAAEIGALADLLPSQTVRDAEMVADQQFSTPPDYGFAVTFAARPRPDDVVFEPSAGTGSLAVHAANAGAAVHVNELSPRRLDILTGLGFTPSKENAEQVHNVFAGTLRPTVVLMNPPFSRTARLGERKVPTVARDHVAAALKLLADGGRLVAVVSARTGSSAAGAWLTELRERYALRANILVDGTVYRRHGTAVETRLLVVDKIRQRCTPMTGMVRTVAELIRVLDRMPARAAISSEADAPAVGYGSLAAEGEARAATVTMLPNGGGDSRFAPFVPRLAWAGAQDHPACLVQSHAMAAVSPPAITYQAAIPGEVIASGRLSLAQLEIVCEAGQAHRQWLPNGCRRGYAAGPGTGFGKGRTIAGVMLDNWVQGRHRALWVTKDHTKLLAAAKRDWAALGGRREDVFAISDFKLGETIDRAQGVLVVGFGTLRSARNGVRRLDQIIAWLGKDFEGVIAYDEAHKMGAALDIEEEIGTTKASQTAIAGVELAATLRRARVLYSSATAASEARNLAFADRLGLWGVGTPFKDKRAFVERIEAAGIAAMEVVARDLRAMGLYAAPTLSYADVTYERMIHHLTPDQTAMYDAMADAWSAVLANLDDAMEAAGASKNGRARGAALSAFWSANQRFFNQVLTAMQMPSLIAAMERDLAAGHAVVVQLVNTMEAAQERALAEEGALEALEDLDLSPSAVLMQFLERSFPIVQYESYEDGDGNILTRPARDSAGNVVICQEAVAVRNRMLGDVAALRVPDGPLEMLLDQFGPDAVAEITGRGRRLVYRRDRDGTLRRVLESRTEAARLADMRAFEADEKRILVFSNAANTGVDFHAGLEFKNQRLRRHYVAQPGWQAKEAVQGMGRTHRTAQRQAPQYILVSTDVEGQRRFISTIARRLGQLGALTKGQRDTGAQGLFDERDDLESRYASGAVWQIVMELYRDRALRVAGMDLNDFQRKLGLKLIDERTGALLDDRIPTVRQFLNRLLALRRADQNALFAEFSERMEENIQAAKDGGTYNLGVEVYRADRVEEVTAPRVVHREATTGAETTYQHLRAWHRKAALPWERALAGEFDGRQRKVLGFVRHARSGAVHVMAAARAITDDKGNVVPMVRLVGPFEEMFTPVAKMRSGASDYRPVGEAEAEKLWRAQSVSDEFTTREIHIFSGLLLPVWDKVQGGYVYRIETETGRRCLGVVVPDDLIGPVLARFGAGSAGAAVVDPAQAIALVLKGEQLALTNGWKLARSRVHGEWRVELCGVRHRGEVAEFGLACETISWKERFFVPTAEGRHSDIGRLLARHPVAETRSIAA